MPNGDPLEEYLSKVHIQYSQQQGKSVLKDQLLIKCKCFEPDARHQPMNQSVTSFA